MVNLPGGGGSERALGRSHHLSAKTERRRWTQACEQWGEKHITQREQMCKGSEVGLALKGSARKNEWI